MLVGLGVVLKDKAARAAHHVQANQFAPVVELVAFFNGKDGVHTALVLALKLGFTDSVFAHVPLGADTNVGLLINEQAQLGREVVLGLVVWRRGQQDDFGIAALDVFRNGFVAPTFAVAQVMAFVNEYQAVALEVGQLFGDLRHWQHHAAQAVFCAVVLPHRLQVFGANDECFVAQVVLKHAGQGGGHHGFSKAHHVANHHAATAMQVSGGNLDSAFLKLEQLLLKAGWKAELTQACTRFGAEVVRNVQIDVVRRNGLFPCPTALDDGGQVSRYIQRPSVCPTRIEPLGKVLSTQVIQHIDIQLTMLGKPGQREVAAAYKTGDGVVDIITKE